MISLFGRDDYSALGIASILDIEKIPYRRMSRLADHDQDLLVVVGTDLSAEESLSIASQPSLVFHGGVCFAREVFAARDVTTEHRPCAIALSAPIWSQATTEIAASFGKPCLRIPLAPVCDTGSMSNSTLLARTEPDYPSGRKAQAAIARLDHCVWSLIDFGTAFAHLLTENYFSAVTAKTGSSALRRKSRRVAEDAYYAAPKAVRHWAQRGSYALAERRLLAQGERASEYPIDASGWLLIELVKQLVRHAAGFLVRLERWPAPYRAAAVLTHDLEPQQFAYSAGLDRLLGRLTPSDPPSALGLVASAASRYLTEDQVGRIGHREVYCHGLDHRGENVRGRAAVTASLDKARAKLQRHVKRPINGYRSPRLDRSVDLMWALDHTGFDYDSSYPDVDRENPNHYGGGVRVNVPYWPLIEHEPGRWRASKCLELPLTAPDCIQPLYAGLGLAALRGAVAEKAAFVRATAGLYVALVHAGVFGEEDADLREEHLGFVRSRLSHPDTWQTSIRPIVQWWRSRAALQLAARRGEVTVLNNNSHPVVSAQLVAEEGERSIVFPLPQLDPGSPVTVRWPGGENGKSQRANRKGQMFPETEHIAGR